MADDPQELVVRDQAAWRSWLAKHHAEPEGIWLVLAKKGTTKPTSLSYDEALEEALCHGWIDGQTRRRDDGTYTDSDSRRVAGEVPGRSETPKGPSASSPKGGCIPKGSPR